MDPTRQLLRHILATVAYRGGKAWNDAPEGFADFRISETSRTPLEILAHMGDLFHWTLGLASQEKFVWQASTALPWDQEKARLTTELAALDSFLASNQPMQAPIERLVQGPILDSLTHVGQLTMLRRLAGSPVRGENYFKAEIAIGNTAA